MSYLEHDGSLPEPKVFEDFFARRVFFERATKMMARAQEAVEVVFLDLTCQPLAHLFGRLWPYFYPDRELPRDSSLNIGTEKVRAVYNYAWEQGLTIGFEAYEIIPYINSKEKLERIFGVSAIAGLKHHLQFPPNGFRLVVDNLKNTGGTLILCEEILKALDPGRDYKFFCFEAKLPWYETGTLVKDWDPESGDASGNPFFAVPQELPALVIEGQTVLAKLDKIVPEIALAQLTKPFP